MCVFWERHASAAKAVPRSRAWAVAFLGKGGGGLQQIECLGSISRDGLEKPHMLLRSMRVSKSLLPPSKPTAQFRIARASRELGRGVEVRTGAELNIQEVPQR